MLMDARMHSAANSARRWSWLTRISGDVLALTLTEHSVRYVLASNVNERGATIVASGIERRGNETLVVFLKRVKALLPKAKRAIAVFALEDYQIVQTDAPNVPAAELRDAVRWRTMEFLGIPPDNLTLDVLAIGNADNRLDGVFAVSAQNDLVRIRMQQFAALGINLSVIEIAETGQRNLLKAALAAEANPAQVVGALVKSGEQALLTILVEGELFFFRRFEFDAGSVAATSQDAEKTKQVAAALSAHRGGGAGNNDLADSELAMRSLAQLHRSLDLWDDHYAKYPLELLLVDAGADSATVAARLKRAVAADVRPLPLAGVFTSRVKALPNSSLPPWLDTDYAPLLGTLLRPLSTNLPASQINLYNAALLPPKHTFSAHTMAMSLALVLLVLAGVSWWSFFEAGHVHTQVIEHQARLALNGGRSAADTTLARAQQIATLEQSLKSKQVILDTRRVLREQLGRGMASATNAHSALMRLIATSIPAQVWLTELRVSGNRVEIAGRTLDPMAFNVWMSRLGDSIFFASKPISMLRLENSEFATAGTSGATGATGAIATLPGVYSFGIIATPAQPLDDDGGKVP